MKDKKCIICKEPAREIYSEEGGYKNYWCGKTKCGLEIQEAIDAVHDH